MAKIKSLILENFGPFRGKHKISFSTDEEKNLTVVFGGYTFSFGPPSITGSMGHFHFSTMISDGIRNALGKNVTKNWSEWFPEHYSTDPKSSVEIEGKAPVINEENDFLYFFKPNMDYDEQETHHPLVVYGDHRLSLVSDPKIEKFVSQKVADEMNNIGEKWKFFKENGIKFVFENKQIQVQNAEGKQVTFKHNPNIIKSVAYAILSGAKMKTNFFEFIGFILFLALRRVHLPEDSFAIIEGGRGFMDNDTIRAFFSTFLRQCPQVIFLTGKGSTWAGESGYHKGLEELKQSQKSISRVYRMTGKDIGKYGGYDGDNAEEMELHFVIDGVNFPIYLDSHATTPVDGRVFDEMKPFFTENFGNASSLDHTFGYDASVAVQSARETLSNAIGCKMDEIVFTSGATESDNLALIGVMEKYKEKGNHIITCKTEHKAILDCANHLEENGCEVTYLSVNENGEIDLDELESAITDKTVLISIMAANNEVGTIAELAKIGKIAHKHEVLFHTDAAQAVGHIPIDVEKMKIDLMSFSSHKIYGPKGIGALYVRSLEPRVEIGSILHGGGQERNIRSGTLNVPGIVGFAKAVSIAIEEMEQENVKFKKLTDMMLKEFEKLGGKLNGHKDNRLLHNLNVRFDGIESKAIINSVSKKIAISAGSACTTQLVEPSHVLLAMGLTEDQSHESIRIGLGRFTTEDEVKIAVEEIHDAIEMLQKIRG
ncbi:cysteine desulfurase [Candidatus Nitrosopelagicus sp.]|nr:cysteine desulfurase [Candidatus Nitrosopelagicus sp.]